MLGGVDLTATENKDIYREKIDAYRKQLTLLQLKIKELGIPVIITFDGWSAAGKGTLISKALTPLDPRYFNVYTMDKVSEDQYMRPFLWRYAINLPKNGDFAIFDKSWNMSALPCGNVIRSYDKMDKDGIYYDIQAFEEALTASGALILKFFLHISKKEQAERFKELEKSEDTRWRVTEADWDQNRHYDKYYALFDRMLARTGAGASEWTVIPANDKRVATITFFEAIIPKLEKAIEEAEKAASQAGEDALPGESASFDVLSGCDLTKTLPAEDYNRRLNTGQERLSNLCFKLYRKRRSVVIVFEGWDAAGKGGCIKRLTEELDPRGYDVHPVSAPSREELSRHYLWRFWRGMPKDGHLAIFDRSWYGRVMVERLEGLCTEAEWRQAYKEINDMERHLANHGVIILKFWLHVTPEEQLLRFQSRMEDPLKRHKIGEEDWRNRAKWDGYLTAVNEMLAKTSTHYAPWTVVEANCKKYARVKTLEHVVKTLEKEL